jgi:hypothetical protein
VDRPFVLAVRADGTQLRADDAAARRRAGRGLGRRRPGRVSDLRRASRGGDAGGHRPTPRDLARRRRRRVHVGRVCAGDLRGGEARMPGRADHDRRAQDVPRRGPPTRSCAARSRHAAATALARRLAGVPRPLAQPGSGRRLLATVPLRSAQWTVHPNCRKRTWQLHQDCDVSSPGHVCSGPNRLRTFVH